MRAIHPTWSFERQFDGDEIIELIEKYGRTCYKSEEKICNGSAIQFVKNIIARGHESVLEHEIITAKIICDRGVSHEIVRHRIASYSQESTRYCNYTDQRFGNEIVFIIPWFWENDEYKDLYQVWEQSVKSAEESYFKLIQLGAKPEEARSILPNSLKTEIVVTMNLREWRHFFSLRAAKTAHPQMREIAIPMLEGFNQKIPVVFNDILLKLQTNE